MQHAKIKLAFLIPLIVIAAIHAAGLADSDEIATTGFAQRSGEIVRLRPGGAAEQAGLKVGDQVQTIDGVAPADLPSWPRTEVGQVREIVVERDGETLTLGLTQERLPPIFMALFFGMTLVMACFLLAGAWAYLREPGSATLLLGLFGLFMGAALVAQPRFTSELVTNIGNTFTTLAFCWSMAFLLHLALRHPEPGRVLRSRIGWMLVHALPALSAITILLLIVLGRDPSKGVGGIVSTAMGLGSLGFLFLSVVLFARSWFKATSGDRVTSGLNVILLGLAASILPIVFVIVLNMVAPRFVGPGVQFLFLSLGLLPLFLAHALTRPRTATASALAA